MALQKLFFVGVKGLIRNSKGDILLLHAGPSPWRDRKESYWDLPGGRIEEGDDELTTLHKEIREETGITDIYDAEYLQTVLSTPTLPIKDNDRTAGLLLRIWQVKICEENEITISHEHIGYEWLPPAEAAMRLRSKYLADFCEYVQSIDTDKDLK